MFKKRGQKKTKKVDKIELVMAALGVMQDETNKPVSSDDIAFCLQIDFKQKMKDIQIIEILSEASSQGLCEKLEDGWVLTAQGEQIADSCLDELSE